MNDTTFQGNGKVAYVPVVVTETPAKQTNADPIRAMTDEELAAWINEAVGMPYYYNTDTESWLNWLKQEANT